MQIILKIINAAPRKLMLWIVTYGCFYEIVMYPISYYNKYDSLPSLDWKSITLIASLVGVLGAYRTYEKKQGITQ